MVLRISLATSIVAAVCLLGTSAAMAQDEVTVDGPYALPVLEGGVGRAWRVNELGQIVGDSFFEGGGQHAVLWTENHQIVDLGAFQGGYFSQAYGINDHGDVVGQASESHNRLHAFVWLADTGVMERVFPDDDVYWSIAYDINSNGQIVGRYRHSDFAWEQAFLHDLQTGVTTNLGLLPDDTESNAYSINSHGDVVGSSRDTYWDHRATLWSGGEMIDLTSEGVFSSSEAYAINDGGAIAGYDYAGNVSRAILWTEGQVIDLGSFDDSGFAFATFGVNDHEHVVGASATASGMYHAFFWTHDAGMIDLDPSGGLGNSTAVHLNNSGTVVGYGNNTPVVWYVDVPLPAPDEIIGSLIEDIIDLVNTGVLGSGTGNALTSKLDAALRMIERGNTDAATNVLVAFINQVEALVNSGRLSAEEAQQLIDAANAAIEELEAEQG